MSMTSSELNLVGFPRLLDRPNLVGILNVTPDSFFDGGRYAGIESAVHRGMEMFSEGAVWVDVGGQSTRPGSEEIPVAQEINRVIPVISALFAAYQSRHGRPPFLSVDTYRAAVAERALAAGAVCVNDISGFSLDPGMVRLVASAGCPVVITHMQGTPKTMQEKPVYGDIWPEVMGYFEDRIDLFLKSGGAVESVAIDPGIGFGKGIDHTLDLLHGIDHLRTLGRPIFLGCSRKSFIQQLLNRSHPQRSAAPDARLPGSLAAAGWAAARGVEYLRVHDVAETAQFLAVWKAVSGA